jgi:hypothetical protein
MDALGVNTYSAKMLICTAWLNDQALIALRIAQDFVVRSLMSGQ